MHTFSGTTGNAGTQVTSTTDFSSVTFDDTLPAVPATSGWGLVVLAAALLAMTAISRRWVSGSRPAARP